MSNICIMLLLAQDKNWKIITLQLQATNMFAIFSGKWYKIVVNIKSYIFNYNTEFNI